MGRVIAVLLGVFCAAFSLLTCSALPTNDNLQPRDRATGNKWTARALTKMAKGRAMAAVVSNLTGNGLTENIDTTTDIKRIRTTILESTGGQKNNMLAKFANTHDAAATCAAAGTAGEEGLDVCVARCKRKPFVFWKTPHERACYILCSLAVAPCETEEAPTQGFVAAAMQDFVVAIKWSGVQMVTAFEEMRIEFLFANMLMAFFLAIACIVTLQCNETEAIIRKAAEELAAAKKENTMIKLNSVCKTRARLAKGGGFHALHDFGAWAIYEASKNKADDARREAGSQLLCALLSVRRQRLTAGTFAQWKGSVATKDAVDNAPQSRSSGVDRPQSKPEADAEGAR